MKVKWAIAERDGKFYPEYWTARTGWVVLGHAFNGNPFDGGGIAKYDNAEQAALHLKKLGVTIEEHTVT